MAGKHLDFDGDGRAEIAVSSPWGIGLLKYSRGGLTAPAMQPNGTRFNGWLLNTADNVFTLTGDFDGDDRTEMLLMSPWGVGILEQSGSTFGCPVLAPNGSRFDGWLLNTGDNRMGPAGDFDGDNRDEWLVVSPWGMGVLKFQGGTLRCLALKPNGTALGGWTLNTAVDRIAAIGDFDGDGRDEILVTSPTGMGILRLSGTTFTSVVVVGNGTRLGGWLLNTADNHIWTAADFDGNGRDDILLTSPWGLGILRLAGSSLTSSVMASNGTRFGGWLLNTADNRFGPTGDLDGDGRPEILVSSPWGLGVLKLRGSSMAGLMLAPNGTRFGGWLLNSADNQVGMGGQLIRLHVKVLTNPTISIETMIVEMQRVYELLGIRVQRVSTETLNLPLLNDVDVGSCIMGSPTAEQTQLFGNRNNAGPNDVVIYFVRSTVPANNGCAVFPAGRPGAVVAQGATRWTLAHEVGHVLGLRHVDDPPPPNPAAPPAQPDRLMTGRGTGTITNPPPDLAATENIRMRNSRLTHNV